MRTSTSVPLPLAIVRITGMYAAVVLIVMGATYWTAAFHGIRDSRAGEVSLAALVVIGSLWIYSLYRMIRTPLASNSISDTALEQPTPKPSTQDAG